MKNRWFVVLEATTYTRVYGQQQLGKYWCVVVGKFSLLKNYIHIKYFHTLSVFENIFTMKKGELQYMFAPSCNHKWLHQIIVTCMWPFGHVPFAAFASNSLQLLHGYLTGLLTILGALKKPP